MYAAWMCWRSKWLWYLQKIYIIFITRNPPDINACLKLPFLLYSILNQVCAEQVAACRSLAWSYRGFKCCKEIIRIPWIGGGFWKQNITWQNIPNIPIMVFSKSWHLSKSFAPSGLSIPIMYIKIRRPQPKRGSAEKRLQAGADEKWSTEKTAKAAFWRPASICQLHFGVLMRNMTQ